MKALRLMILDFIFTGWMSVPAGWMFGEHSSEWTAKRTG